ncbi:DeoR/GlpR family DNA-binding transcription regulator [Pseudophaeobacter sp.]|uniref:DeoR/GlpR family DNA-binding transcription regulator n=1 Tax=Pseudophaeobacter sp. TaxID=1971739 RepID=UPI003298606E
MKRSDLDLRRDQIIALLAENGALSAQELCTRLDVSVQTIRADLRDLDEAALVQRRNGMAQLRQQAENIGYLPRLSLSHGEKHCIAQAVQPLVKNGARVALGTGTTVAQCARLLATRQDLFVASNSIHAVMALQNAPGAQVDMAGGSVRLRDLDVISSASIEFFAHYRMEQAIFSCGGISPSGEVLDYNSEEIAARQAITNCARQTILVVDSEKFGLDLPCRALNIWDYDVVVTGAELCPQLRQLCHDNGCKILLAGSPL